MKGNNHAQNLLNINNLNLHNNENDNEDFNNNNNQEFCHNNQEEIKDLSQYSTKEEFSDFEDEIEAHEACIDSINNNNNENNTTTINETLTSNEFHSESSNPNLNVNIKTNQEQDGYECMYPNKIKEFINFIEKNNTKAIDKKNPACYSDNNLPYIHDTNCNYNMYQKPYIPKLPNTEESLHKKLPLLKNFKPKYTKRENIDKKILRRFKGFLKDKYKSKQIKLDNNNNLDKHFWLMFINGNLLPPMKYIDQNTHENVEFKSFNSKFLLWLFTKKGSREFYDMFILEQGKSVLSSLVADYNVTDSSDMNQLEYYMNNLAFIFDFNSMSNVNNVNPVNDVETVASPGKAPKPDHSIAAVSSKNK
jgi:hypothetical protein